MTSTPGCPITNSCNFVGKPMDVQLAEATLRRRLIGELQGIENMVGSVPSPDALSLDISEWRREFRKALDTHLDIWPIFEHYLELMQEMLLDSITLTPLDSQALLGSDGYCYGYKALCLLENSLPDSLRARSPFDLENPQQGEFVTVPHQLARHMIQWLAGHGKAPSESPELTQAFQTLEEDLGSKKVSGLIPSTRNHRLRRIQNRVALRREQDRVTKVFQRSLDEEKARLQLELEKEFEGVSERVQVFAKNTMEQLNRMETKHVGEVKKLQQRVSQLEKKEEKIQEEVRDLVTEVAAVSKNIEIAEKEQIQVQRGIKRLETAIQKRKKKQAKHVWQCVAGIAACVTGTVVFQQLASGGILIMQLPESGGTALHIGASL